MADLLDVALVDYDPVPFDLTPAIREGMVQTLAEVGARLRLAQCRGCAWPNAAARRKCWNLLERRTW